MFLWITIALAIFWGLLKKFNDGLVNTSQWFGKITLSDHGDIKESIRISKQTQLALMMGWPNYLLFFTYTLIPLTAIILGFIYSWWGGLLIIFLFAFCAILVEFIFRNNISYYLLFHLKRMTRRIEAYKKKNDIERATAAEFLSNKIKEILAIYLNSGIKVPKSKEIKANPYGDVYFLLESNFRP